jgi:cell shape-determining protein MreC
MDKEKIGILISESSTLFGFYGDSFDSKRAVEIVDEIYVEFLKLEKENACLKDRLKHEVEMIESAANDEIKKLEKENARLRNALEIILKTKNHNSFHSNWITYNTSFLRNIAREALRIINE